MTMITPSYLGETIEYSSLHACRSTLEDPTQGHVYRTAMTTDREMRHCGHHGEQGINDGDTIDVYADGPCSH